MPDSVSINDFTEISMVYIVLYTYICVNGSLGKKINLFLNSIDITL